MLGDVFEAVDRYKIDDVLFQDENFFANQNRVGEFCAGVNKRDKKFTWVATSRADQIAPLDDAFLAELSSAKLRRVIIGAESGSQEMLDLMKKGSSVEANAEFIHNSYEVGLSVRCTMFKGFPGETVDDILSTRFLNFIL